MKSKIRSRLKNVEIKEILHLNPPFSLSVKTKIGDEFLRALDECFPSYHPLSKIINRNTVKLSYRCMPNIKQSINRHNQQVQKGRTAANAIAGCSCVADRECPLNGNCQGPMWWKRMEPPTLTQNWRVPPLKRYITAIQASWSGELLTEGKSLTPLPGNATYVLKKSIISSSSHQAASLNKRSELFSTCRHRWQQPLENVWRVEVFVFIWVQKKNYLYHVVVNLSPVAEDCDIILFFYVMLSYETICTT